VAFLSSVFIGPLPSSRMVLSYISPWSSFFPSFLCYDPLFAPSRWVCFPLASFQYCRLLGCFFFFIWPLMGRLPGPPFLVLVFVTRILSPLFPSILPFDYFVPRDSLRSIWYDSLNSFGVPPHVPRATFHLNRSMEPSLSGHLLLLCQISTPDLSTPLVYLSFLTGWSGSGRPATRYPLLLFPLP